MNLCPKKLGNADFHRVNLEFQYHRVSRHRKPQLSEIGPSETCFCEAMAVACLDSVEDKEKFVQDTHHYSEYTSVKVELAKIIEMGVSNKPPEFIKMKPPGKVPMVESGNT